MGYVGWAWIIVIAACLIIEASTMGLTTIWFAIGGFIALIVKLIGFSVNTQIIIFLIISILCLVVTRPIAVRKLKVGKTKTNLDSIIGDIGIVESTINNLKNEGTVKYKGQLWSARAEKDEIIEINEVVVINEIKGVKLIVGRKK